ncbi:hypothetical protein [Microbacterium sp. NPDC079995]|uniref:hypothetical protein n=1 Tax=unclassified Microbacterium TaxID=2609290 RepID=UPI00344F251F
MTDDGALLDCYRLVPTLEMYGVGLFDSAVTVLSQQVRALNLVWALEHADLLAPEKRPRIAVIGAGFAGLSFVAGLAGKDIPADVTILEQRDSILPLQQGADSRWLHPHIYDWPAPGSQASSAGLPVLNWTAARASDVVVQVESAWRELLATVKEEFSARLFCNVGRSRVDRVEDKFVIEWIGQERDVREPARVKGEDARSGNRETFDLVVLATGFGTEVDGAFSYWRNETLAQPALDRTRTDYLVSGYGDGGWIDLFRLRIMNFRQDRILGELFEGMTSFVGALREVKATLEPGASAIPAFEEAWQAHQTDAQLAESRLRRRLRHDTAAVMQLRENYGLVELFEGRRVSFQNQLLAWMLFVVGGFDLRAGDLEGIKEAEAIGGDHVVLRHGPKPFENLARVLGGDLRKTVMTPDNEPVDPDLRTRCRQDDSVRWGGGYFDRPLGVPLPDEKAHWNREHLPAVTRVLAAGVCGAIADHLAQTHDASRRLRVTLHRAVAIGNETVLQQCCDYRGLNLEDQESTAGRTFPTRNGLIGQAFLTRRTVKSRTGSRSDEVRANMDHLELESAARPMSADVRSLLAIPVLQESASAVVGVIFLDSYVEGFFDDNALVDEVRVICEGFLRGLLDELPRTDRTLSNVEYWSGSHEIDSQPQADVEGDSLESLATRPVSVAEARLNIDLVSFIEPGGGHGAS